MNKFVFVLTVMLLLPFQAQAARFSGQYLMSVCASDEKGREITPGGHIACQAYIAGILDYHTLIKSLGTAPGIDFCVPESAGMTKIQNRVQSYVLRNKNQHSSFIAAPGVALGLYNAFPCK